MDVFSTPGRPAIIERPEQKPISSKKATEADTDHLLRQAFENSLQANLLYTVSHGMILKVNRAACRLLGYSKKMLLTKNTHDIFDVKEPLFKKMHSQERHQGEFEGVLTVVKKNGKRVPCEITSATFFGDHHINKAIITIRDMSKGIKRQKKIDLEKEKIVSADLFRARFTSDAALHRLVDLERRLDREMTIQEQMLSSSLLQKLAFEKEVEERVNQVIRVKERQIAEAIIDAKELERSDIGKELHDNVNQLLGASQLYLNMAKRDDINMEMYLGRSSEYLLTAIEEIRKLTKGLTAAAIKSFGLQEAISNICRDTMESNRIKLSCIVDPLIENRVNDKFQLAVFRIVQEQLSNVLKHAQASTARIRLSQIKDSILLVISDDGIGFDTDKKRNGIGIANIQSRVELYKGTAHFKSSPGKGCVLTVTFPVNDRLLNQQGGK
jgi:PAS domain S-box-containing protein